MRTSRPNRGGDDWEDDFVPDELVALSADEEDEVPEVVPHRPVEDDEEGVDASQEQNLVKKRKRKEREKQKKEKRRKLAELGSAPFVTGQPPSKLAPYLSEMQAKSFPGMSKLELDDRRIPVECIADTSQWEKPRTMDQLPNFITEALPSLHTRLKQKSKTNGAPTLIFVAGAALRVADITRVIKESKLRGDKGGEVAKLFSRHFKLEEHVALLTRTKVGAAVGTPGRIGKLLSNGALAVSALSHIILDVTFEDAKKRSLLDIPETRNEVFETVLGFPTIQEMLKQGRVQIVLF